jgi:hypothetical protein
MVYDSGRMAAISGDMSEGEKSGSGEVEDEVVVSGLDVRESIIVGIRGDCEV